MKLNNTLDLVTSFAYNDASSRLITDIIKQFCPPPPPPSLFLGGEWVGFLYSQCEMYAQLG